MEFFGAQPRGILFFFERDSSLGASIKGLGWKLMECASSEDCNDGWRRINNKILSAERPCSLSRSLGALNFLISSFDGAREN
jgi:hypothetical protein